jgi:hypothetical protein
MSYARFGEQGSDVYVYLCTAGYLECCACALRDGRFVAHTTREMLAHLDEHEAAGHRLAARTRRELAADAAENDAWIARRRAEEA